MVNSKKKPSFNVPNAGYKKRVKSRWRRPRGIDNKKRIKKASMGKSPKVGYSASRKYRHLHSTGDVVVRVFNESDLVFKVSQAKKTSDSVSVRVYIASSVGKKKREQIRNSAKSLGVKVVN